jgi:hypothetical protein
MASIASAQSRAIDNGLFDNLGSSRNIFEDLKPANLAEKLAAKVVLKMQENLNASKSNGSGALSNSIEISNTSFENNVFKVDIKIAYYGQFVNKGVAGTISGSSKAGYKFKTNNPSPAMLASLAKGQKKAGKKIRNNKKNIGDYDKKNQRTSLASSWGAAVNIKKYGIAATEFIDKAISDVRKEIS